MMKRILFVTILAFCCSSCASTCRLTGRIEGGRAGQQVVLVRLHGCYYAPGPRDRYDTVRLGRRGAFRFRGPLEADAPARIIWPADSARQQRLYFALCAGRTRIEADNDNLGAACITGTIYDDARVGAFRAGEAAFEAFEDSLKRVARSAGRGASLDALRDTLLAARRAQHEVRYRFFREDTPYAAFAYLETARVWRDDAAAMQAVLEGFAPTAARSGFAALIRRRWEALRAAQPGNPCPDLVLVDRAGRTHALADYRGRWLLLSYWSAGCPGSHRADPMIRSVWERYHAEGLEVLGLSDPTRVTLADPGPEGVFGVFDHPYPDIDLSQQTNFPFLDTFMPGGTPYLILVSPQGRIEAASIGTEVLERVKSVFEDREAAAAP